MPEETSFATDFEAYIAEQRRFDVKLETKVMDDSAALRKRPGGCDGCDNCQNLVPTDFEV